MQTIIMVVLLDMKKLEHKKELIERQNLKDSADDFIQGKQDKIDLYNKEEIANQSEYLKKQFVGRKKDLSSFLPKEKDDSKDNFTKLGSFKTGIGAVSVGFEKFKPSSESKLRFTLLSKEEKDFDDKNSDLDFDDKRNYFKKSYDEQKYQENSTTLEFDPKEKKLQKSHEIFTDNIQTDDNELLYDDELECSEIEDIRENAKILNPRIANDAVSDLKTIQNEKKEDNHELQRELKKFSELFENNKLKKFEDSDQLKVAQNRIQSYILRKRMEEMKKYRKSLCGILKMILEKIKKKGVE